MANRAKVVELAEGDRERPGRLSTCATASAREHAGPEALLYKASGRADADAPGRGRRRETSESDRLWAVS